MIKIIEEGWLAPRDVLASLYLSVLFERTKNPFSPQKPTSLSKSFKWPEFAFKHGLFRRLLDISNLWTSNQKPQIGSKQGLNPPGPKRAFWAGSRIQRPRFRTNPGKSWDKVVTFKRGSFQDMAKGPKSLFLAEKEVARAGLKFYLRRV